MYIREEIRCEKIVRSCLFIRNSKTTNKQAKQQQTNKQTNKKLPIATTKYAVTERETDIKAESRHGYLWYGHYGALNSTALPHLKYELA